MVVGRVVVKDSHDEDDEAESACECHIARPSALALLSSPRQRLPDRPPVHTQPFANRLLTHPQLTEVQRRRRDPLVEGRLGGLENDDLDGQ